MRGLGKLGFAVSAWVLALVAAAPGDSAVPPPVSVDAPAPPAGGWTRQGWSDEPTPAAANATRPVAAADTAPRADSVSPRWPERDEWRRRTWDGGQGNAFRYRRGERLPNAFSAPAYVVRDWQGYRLPAPGPGRDWVRYYDDAVLVDRYGIVVAAVPAIGWDRAGPSAGGYAGQAYPAYDDRGYPDRDPRYGTAYDSGECRTGADGGFLPGTCTRHAADGSFTVTTTTAPVVTTHTVVTTRPVRVVKRKPAVVRKRARVVRPAR